MRAPLLMSALLIVIVPLATLASPPQIACPTSKFHRLYVLGNGDSDFEKESFRCDMDEVREDFEQPENQANGSTSATLTEPTKQELEDQIDVLQGLAQAGDQVTIVFSGHGNVDSFRLRNGVSLTANELAQMLMGFAPGVCLTVIIDSCYGGSFEDEIEAIPGAHLIGVGDLCPIDPWGVFGGFTSTLSEDTADKGGERDADANEDGKVSAVELEAELIDCGWAVGQPPPAVPKSGKSKCDGCPPLPALDVQPPAGEAGQSIMLSGAEFTPGTLVDVTAFDPDSTAVALGQFSVEPDGTFQAVTTVPFEEALIYAVAEDDKQDWFVFGAASVSCNSGDPESGVLFVNGQQGLVEVDVDGQLSVVLKDIPTGNGRFVLHLNPGFPDASTVTPVLDLGLACFPFVGGSPAVVANCIGKEALVGSSAYFGFPTKDPDPAPTFVRSLLQPVVDRSNLAPGTEWTLQGIMVNAASSGSKPVSITNAVRIRIVP